MIPIELRDLKNKPAGTLMVPSKVESIEHAGKVYMRAGTSNRYREIPADDFRQSIEPDIVGPVSELPEPPDDLTTTSTDDIDDYSDYTDRDL